MSFRQGERREKAVGVSFCRGRKGTAFVTSKILFLKVKNSGGTVQITAPRTRIRVFGGFVLQIIIKENTL